jgi:sulfur transfer complex TusBCD TusB component (DsrH family)
VNGSTVISHYKELQTVVTKPPIDMFYYDADILAFNWFLNIVKTIDLHMFLKLIVNHKMA